MISDLDPDQCFELGYLVDALEDSTQNLLPLVEKYHGLVNSMKQLTNKKWNVNIINNDQTSIEIEINAVILACGSIPITPKFNNSSQILHELDRFVNPEFVKNYFIENPLQKQQKWCIVGSSHSGMLIIKNLIENNVSSILNITKSSILRFQHYLMDGTVKFPGIGLKGPVGDFAKNEFYNHSNIEMIQYNSKLTWNDYIEMYSINHIIFAIGFQINHNNNNETIEQINESTIVSPTFPSIQLNNNDYLTSENYEKYDLLTGEIPETNGSLFGAGITFPQHHYYLGLKEVSNKLI